MMDMSNNATTFPRLPSWAFFLTGAFLILGIGGRFAGLDWDLGLSYHPDELNIALAVAKLDIPHQMHPDFFAYNGFSLYLYRLLAQGTAWLTGDGAWTSDIGRITWLGRCCSAALSTLSLGLLYILGGRTISPRGGYLALLLGAGCAGLIQAAHYAVTETLLVFWILLQALVAARMVQNPAIPRFRSWILLGVLGGFALGTKTTALLLLAIPYVVLLVRLRRGDRTAAVGGALGGVLAGCIAAFAVSPYSLLDFGAFQASMAYETALAKGTKLVPYTLQFLGTLPYLFFLENLPWHLGPFLPLVGIGGAILWTTSILRGRTAAGALPLLLFGGVYFAYVGSMFARFIRYLVPLYPTLLLAGAWGMDRLLAWGERRSSGLRHIAQGCVALVLVGGFLWGGAVTNLFLQENPRTAASRWIATHVAPGTVLVTETWDYRLPAAIPGVPSGPYEFLSVPAPDPDSEEKLALLADVLSRGEYYVLASGRNADQLSRLPDRYPLMARFYRLLRSGELGYQEVARWETFPSLLGFSIRDVGAEETFRVFDHPTVILFRNTGHLDAPTLREVLLPQ